MKVSLYICFLFFSMLAFGQDEYMPSIEYQQLSPDIIEKAFRLESSKHRLGRVTIYSYTASGKSEKITCYENKKEELILLYEDGYGYDENDKFFKKYTYVPSGYRYDRTTYTYPTDSLLIITTIDKRGAAQKTTVRNCYTKSGRKVIKSEITERGSNPFYRAYLTETVYNENNKIQKKLRTNLIDGSKEWEGYEYDGEEITKHARITNFAQTITYYKKGRPHIEEYMSKSTIRQSHYFYTKKGKEKIVKRYENGKPTSSGISSYNRKGLRTKYKLLNKNEKYSGITLYEYNEQDQLVCKIELYGRKKKKKKKPVTSGTKPTRENEWTIPSLDEVPCFTPFKTERENGFYIVDYNNTDTIKIPLVEKSFIAPNEVESLNQAVNKCGRPLLEVKLTAEGVEKFKQFYADEETEFFALVIDETVYGVFAIPLPDKEGKIRLLIADTLKEITQLINKYKQE